MCKKKQFKYCPSTIDKCMEFPLVNLNWALDNKKVKIVACCCGHGKYPKTIVVRKYNGTIFELLSGELIPRKRNFYKKDSQGYYYIPEVLEKKRDEKCTRNQEKVE